MSFTIKHPDADLYWSNGIFGRVQLGTVPNVYMIEGRYIKNTATGNYVNHSWKILHEGGTPDEFEMGPGGISTNGQFVGSGQFLTLGDDAVRWVRVPVSRAASLIAESEVPRVPKARNAKTPGPVEEP